MQSDWFSIIFDYVSGRSTVSLLELAKLCLDDRQHNLLDSPKVHARITRTLRMLGWKRDKVPGMWRVSSAELDGTPSDPISRSSISLPQSTWRRVRKIAAADGRTLNGVVEEAVINYLSLVE